MFSQHDNQSYPPPVLLRHNPVARCRTSRNPDVSSIFSTVSEDVTAESTRITYEGPIEVHAEKYLLRGAMAGPRVERGPSGYINDIGKAHVNPMRTRGDHERTSENNVLLIGGTMAGPRVDGSFGWTAYERNSGIRCATKIQPPYIPECLPDQSVGSEIIEGAVGP
ncbi:hypothetical protein B0H17DRAFT_1149988 [Mycena rosella]|uniref:Uncharacterized protein n=1 Tax=Mycena rosella TaxID=1033263 RepID=A0AAD7BVE5_MYCRO|nr:hypothetical protein B0H17DRAFT_1149988 [Mycena rosella]